MFVKCSSEMFVNIRPLNVYKMRRLKVRKLRLNVRKMRPLNVRKMRQLKDSDRDLKTTRVLTPNV